MAREMTWGDLWADATSTGARLTEFGDIGARIGIACDDPRDFVVAIAACFISGRVAVPVPVTLSRRSAPRAAAIVQAGRTAAMLVSRDSSVTDWLMAPPSGGQHLVTVSAGATSAVAGWSNENVGPEQLALIQFTSGSTGQPTGVALSHANLALNCSAIATAYGLNEETGGLSWLPLHHDMGLIGHVLTPILLGCRSTIMDPLRFLQRPLSWLRLVKPERATITSAPNFAYEICSRAAAKEGMEGIDLSGLTAMVCGGEPVIESTVTRFIARFQAAGLAPAAFSPSYGLAEATLLVATGRNPVGPRFVAAPPSTPSTAAIENQRMTVADLGVPVDGVRVRIVGEDGNDVADGKVGEITITGGCVGKLIVADGSLLASHELQTGDLGFLERGRLRVTGRKKDLIILRGQNIYPSDVEAIVQDASTLIAPGGVAAIGVESDGTQRLVTMIELSRKVRLQPPEEENLRRLVVESLSRALGHVPADVQIWPFGELPRTSSGKIRRSAAAALYKASTVHSR